MKSLQTKRKITTAAAVAAVIAAGAGCSSMHRTAYNEEAVPVYNNGQAAENFQTAQPMGAPGNYSETQSGSWQSGQDVVIPLEREQLNVGKQEVDNGSLRIRKIVKTKTVNQPVEIREETVTVDRIQDNNANRGNTSLNTPFQEGEITIPLKREQPLVQTQIVPNGSVVIHRQDTAQQVNASGQVRSEHVVAEPIGNPQNVNISSNLKTGDRDFDAAGAPPAQYGTTSGVGESQPITQMHDLCADNDTDKLYGRHVKLSNVRVEKVYNDQLIAVRAENGKTLIVRIAQPAPGLHEGEMVALTGIVQQVPEDTSTLGWGPSNQQTLQGHRFYITVENVTPEQQ